jgi:hypothetical protein
LKLEILIGFLGGYWTWIRRLNKKIECQKLFQKIDSRLDQLGPEHLLSLRGDLSFGIEFSVFDGFL